MKIAPEPAQPTKLLAAIHSHATGYTGVAVSLLGFIAPVTALLSNSQFVHDLIFGTVAVRQDHIQQIVTAFVTGCVIGAVGLAAANAGKGPLSPAASTDLPPTSVPPTT